MKPDPVIMCNATLKSIPTNVIVVFVVENVAPDLTLKNLRADFILNRFNAMEYGHFTVLAYPMRVWLNASKMYQIKNCILSESVGTFDQAASCSSRLLGTRRVYAEPSQ